MKIFIIGGFGFIGSNAVSYFIKKGYDVYSCDIYESADSQNYFFIDPANFNFNQIFKENKFDICINASGSANVAFSIKHPKDDFELNVKNVENILESVKNYCPGCKLINFSSAAVYGNPISLPIRESDVINPLSPYGKHKYESERILKKYYDTYNVGTCSLRVFSAYGPGLKKQIFWDVYQKAKNIGLDANGGTVELFGTGKESRDFIFIEDLMYAIEVIIQKDDFNGKAINVATGVEITIEKVVTLFTRLLNPNLQLKFNGVGKMGDPINWKADISLLSSYEFSSKVRITDGLIKYIEWIKAIQN